MDDADSDRLAGAKHRIRSGLRSHAVASPAAKRSVQLADRLAVVHEELDDTEVAPVTDGQPLSEAVESINTDRLHGLRKVTEVIEDDLGVNVGHSKFARIAGMASTFTSMGSFAIAGHNVLLAATALDTAHEKAGSVSAIETPRFFDFYRSLAFFIVEGLLLTTPLKFKTAWRGTRYLNNRVLYRFRNVHNGLYKLLLSEVHYAIRGVVPAAFRDPEAFATYLSSMVMQTVEFIREFEDINVLNFLDTAESIAREFQTFIENTYDVTTGNVDIAVIVEEALSKFTNTLDSRTMYTPTHGF
ncbi:hypothetical protein B4589_004590 [Halolamina sp. CBA1230]|uniref:hypothetical protein n=1 Tax=Halolamina sp. CBA1230 TaxID=1853690 RepID=UPI0009A20C54|nr:hypothetical protein [Halolamina sp. CBA1230]QKY19691.1 hypothetical protein B4589_004590 [Halolamina sp. CBA1230]